MFGLSQEIHNQDSKHLEKKIEELMIRNQMLDKHTEELLEELNVTPKQLTALMESEGSFTPHNWETLQQEKKKLEQKLKTELKNIHNPLKTKKTLSEQRVKQEWLFVK